jgi:predicted glycosyltransferase
VRSELGLAEQERLVVVTLGGGGDGFDSITKYLAGLSQLPPDHKLHSLIITGPEMTPMQSQALLHQAASLAHVTMLEFTNDLMSFLGAADVVISMGGYNTICEILSLGKKAIVIPRVRPVQEQLIRAQRLSRLGFFRYLHPDDLTPAGLMQAVFDELSAPPQNPTYALSLNAHQRIAESVATLLNE